MRVKILGLYWNLRFESLARYRTEDGKRVDGLCDPASTKGRAIQIESKLSGKDQLEAIIHEVEHACDQCQGAPFVHAEGYVEAKARDLTNILWKLGYRRVENR
jgi:hypothetical protein